MNFHSIIEKILEILFPNEKEVLEIEHLDSIFIEQIPKALPINNNFKAIFQYKNKIIRKSIWEIKYSRNRKITQKFSKILYEFILEELSDEIFFSNFNNPLLIPVPISKNNLKEKGFNHCEDILKEIERLDTNNIFEKSFDSLVKIKDTPHQAKIKNKSIRLKNLKNSFKANKEKISGRNVVIIDDVITTGSTMLEIKRTLKEAGAKKVIGFAIAH